LVHIIGGDYTHIPPRPAEARISLANNSRARETLGWEPTMSLEEWLNNA
jgi:nucleoside-diphosphate-sugar epimerase